MLNDPIKTDGERNNFNFSANRKHWNPRVISEIQGGKHRNTTLENQRSFPTANPISRNWKPAKLHVNHLRCLTFGSPLSSMCRVSTVYAKRIFAWLGHFSKIRFFIRFWTMERRKSENEEKSSSTVGLFVIVDNVSSSCSWSPENWRLVHNQSRSVQTLFIVLLPGVTVPTISFYDCFVFRSVLGVYSSMPTSLRLLFLYF